MLRMFPLLAIPVALYNLIVLGGVVIAHHEIFAILTSTFSVPMFSGEEWKIGTGDVILLVAVLMLFAETIKAVGTSQRDLINHGLSMLVFVVALIEFIAVKGFGTSPFFFIVAMALFDTVAGYTITAVASKRDLNLAGNGLDGLH
jgi:hypothetical protein